MQLATGESVTSPKSVAELHLTNTPKRTRAPHKPQPRGTPLPLMSGHQSQTHHLPAKRCSSQLDDVPSTISVPIPAPSNGSTALAQGGVPVDANGGDGEKPKIKKRRNWAPIAVVPMKQIKLPTDLEPEELLKLKLQYQDMATMEQQIFGISTLLSLVKNVLKGSADLKRIAALGRRLSKTRKRFLNCQRGVFDVQNERNPAPSSQTQSQGPNTPATADSNDASSRPSQVSHRSNRSNRSDTDTSMQTASAAMQVSTPEKRTIPVPVSSDTVGSVLTSENVPNENPTFGQFSLGASGASLGMEQRESQAQTQTQAYASAPEYHQEQHEHPQAQAQLHQIEQGAEQSQHPIVRTPECVNQATSPLQMSQHPHAHPSIQGMWQQQQFPFVDNTSSPMENSANALTMALTQNHQQAQNALNTMDGSLQAPLNNANPKPVITEMNGRSVTPLSQPQHYMDAQRAAFEAQQQQQQSFTNANDAFQPQLSMNLPTQRDNNATYPMQLNVPAQAPAHPHAAPYAAFFQQRNVTPSPNVQPPTPLDMQAVMWQQQQQAAALATAFDQGRNHNWVQAHVPKPSIASPVEFFATHYGGGSEPQPLPQLQPTPPHFEHQSKMPVDYVAPDAAETNFSPVTTSGHMY